MSNRRLPHLVGIIAYVSAAAAIAVVLPAAARSVSPAIAQLWGAVVLLTGAFLHELIRRHERERMLAKAVVKQSRSLADAERERTHARLEIDALRESLEASSRRLPNDAAPEVAQIRGEMQLLRKMMDKIMTQADAHGALSRSPVGLDALGQLVPGTVAAEPVIPDSVPVDHPVPLDQPMSFERPEGESAATRSAEPRPTPKPGDIAVLHTIREALTADRVELYLQQVVSLPERRRRFFECYSRLRTAEGTLIFPQQYLPVAERTGLTSTIDNVLLLRCVQLIRKLQARNLDIGFFCNISPSTLRDRVFLEEFAGLLANNRALARGLVFEFRQADFALIEAEASAYLERLAAAGFRFSVDHVTTFDIDLDIRALAERHVRFLKIPGAMLVAAAGGTSTVPLREIQERLKAAGIELVAERIETKAVLRGLEAHGVTLGQGYLLGEPVMSQDR
ncbi:MAG: EAL domain-containing protein [Alphaproteobacteria bacterium]